ncbi:MAG: bifunctional phosphoglucose/phosphomannose isomerase [Patescibacteria group bacterium]
MSEQIIVLDEGKMEEKIRSFPDQLEKAWTTLWTKDVPHWEGKISHVVICGMGGSGIAGKLAKELFADQAIHFETWADYGLPSWVNAETLVIGVSHSGDTEETVDAVKTAVEKKLPLVVISTGGKLAELAQIHAIPIVAFEDASPPRAAIGYLYGSLITLLTKLKLVNFLETQYFQALDELRKATADPKFTDKAEELAISLNNKVPLIAASHPLTAVADRWVTQLNENSKTFAVSATVPELCHNTLVGVDFSIPEKLSVLVLESKYAFSRNIARKKIIEKAFLKKQISAVPLSVSSNSLLAEQWLLLQFGDWLSFYLAGVYGVDPTPVDSINFLKEELKKV